MHTPELLGALKQAYDQECELLQLADAMASSATDLKGQNYELFLQSRQQLKERLNQALSQQVVRSRLPFTY